jgi:hypothetical protein
VVRPYLKRNAIPFDDINPKPSNPNQGTNPEEQFIGMTASAVIPQYSTKSAKIRNFRTCGPIENEKRSPSAQGVSTFSCSFYN